MRIHQIKCDKCGAVIEETIKSGFFEVDDKDLCPTCYDELKSKGEITCKNGFPEFTAKFEGR